MAKDMKVTLEVWRQAGPEQQGGFRTYEVDGVSPDMSFLELLDELNERLIRSGEEPVAFDHDCREGICGSCGFMINGVAHGPEKGTAVCQLHMRKFESGVRLVLPSHPSRRRSNPPRRPPRTTSPTRLERISDEARCLPARDHHGRHLPTGDDPDKIGRAHV